ncbi:cytochrome c [Marinobacter sediminum]|uniref:cytochrome c n=1 Tax=Marinobacter sediminum TaxID=256323 RepID=UPI003569B235
MIKKILSGLIVIAVVVAFLIIWKPAIDEIDQPSADAFSQEQIARGKVLAGLGNCASCHTSDPSKPLAGGVDFPTPFGTLYSTNISPHPEQGIGTWSEEAFVRAMREGVSRDGSHLYPAFPYTHFTKVTDEDLSALYAYVMSRQAVDHQGPDNQLDFPFNLRMLQAGWKTLFFDEERFQPDDSKGDAWNRGAYIAEGLGHCTACHSPRNAFGAEIADKTYNGAVVDNWYAPALNTTHAAPVPWTEDELFQYLRAGGSKWHGIAAGSMASVVHKGLIEAPDDDIRALAVYFQDLTGAVDNAKAAEVAASHVSQAHDAAAPNNRTGEEIFSSACASCHYNAPSSLKAARPELSLNSAVTAPDPVNLLRITLHGIDEPTGLRGLAMPGFSSGLSDADLIALTRYLRQSSGQPPWENLEQHVQDARQL